MNTKNCSRPQIVCDQQVLLCWMVWGSYEGLKAHQEGRCLWSLTNAYSQETTNSPSRLVHSSLWPLKNPKKAICGFQCSQHRTELATLDNIKCMEYLLHVPFCCTLVQLAGHAPSINKKDHMHIERSEVNNPTIGSNGKMNHCNLYQVHPTKIMLSMRSLTSDDLLKHWTDWLTDGQEHRSDCLTFTHAWAG